MKKIMMVALSIVALVSVSGVVNAEKKDSDKQQVTTSKKSEHTKTQPAATTQTEKEKTAIPEIGGKTDEKQDRGLPKAFSGSEDQ